MTAKAMVGVTLDKESPWVLFGIDLARYASVFHVGARQLLWDSAGGVRARLEAPVAVSGEALSEPAAYNDWGPSSAPLSDCEWTAVALPGSLVLERQLVLPAEVEAGIEPIAELEVEAQSPFPVDDRAAGWRIVARDSSTITVCIAITSRASVRRHLQGQYAADNEMPLELWHLSSEGVPVVITGYGEQARESAYRQTLKRLALRSGLIGLLLLLILVMPVIAASMRADRAERLMEEVRSDAADEMRLREEVSRFNSVLEELQQDMAASPDVLTALHRLAADTPDSVFLNRIDLGGRDLRMNGFASDAASYMQQLSEVSWLVDVKAPTAFQRDSRSGLERFLLHGNLTDAQPVPEPES